LRATSSPIIVDLCTAVLTTIHRYLHAEATLLPTVPPSLATISMLLLPMLVPLAAKRGFVEKQATTHDDDVRWKEEEDDDDGQEK